MSRSHYALIIEQVMVDLVNLFTHKEDDSNIYKAASFLVSLFNTSQLSENWHKPSGEIHKVLHELYEVSTMCSTDEIKESHNDLIPALNMLDTAVNIAYVQTPHYQLTASDMGVIHKFSDLIYFDRDAEYLDVDTYVELAKACDIQNTTTSAAAIMDIIIQDDLFGECNDIISLLMISVMANCKNKMYIFNHKTHTMKMSSGTITDIKKTTSIITRYDKISSHFKLRNFTTLR